MRIPPSRFIRSGKVGNGRLLFTKDQPGTDNGVSMIIQDQELLAERQDELVDVATKLVTQRGFQRTSVRQIAEAAG